MRLTARQLLALPESSRRQIAREQSRALGKDNGPTVQPTTEKEVKPCQHHHQQPATSANSNAKTAGREAAPTSDPAARQTFWRTDDRTDRIAPVEVTKATPKHLTIILPGGGFFEAMRDQPGEHYHGDYKTAYFVVLNRLTASRDLAEEALKAFHRKNRTP